MHYSQDQTPLKTNYITKARSSQIVPVLKFDAGPFLGLAVVVSVASAAAIGIPGETMAGVPLLVKKNSRRFGHQSISRCCAVHTIFVTFLQFYCWCAKWHRKSHRCAGCTHRAPHGVPAALPVVRSVRVPGGRVPHANELGEDA
jgi:hypothetical protein